jgi:hypothetical protein
MLNRVISFAICCTLVSCARDAAERDAPPSKSSDSTTSESPAGDQDSSSSARDWKAEFEEMVSTLELNDQEAAKLKQAFEKREGALAAWFNEKGAQLKELEKEMLAAARNRDLPGVRDLKEKAQPLRDELRKTAETLEASIRAALPESRRVEWEAHRLAKRLIGLMESLKLSAEQVATIDFKAAEALKFAAGEKNPQAAGFLKLERDVEQSVLTPEQREPYQAIKKKNPLRSLKTD